LSILEYQGISRKKAKYSTVQTCEIFSPQKLGGWVPR
jgi:hypothetical protein